MGADATGRVVKQAQATGSISLDISAEPSGIYFVKIRRGASVTVRKIVKE